MKLYYAPGACSLSDHIVLEWIGEPYEATKVSREELKSADFMRLNPAGAVPVFEDEGWVLTQNAAILNYLADTFPHAKLGGDGSARSRAEVNRWLAFLNADVHPAFKPLFGATSYLEDDAAIAKSKEHARTALKGLFARVDRQLADNPWIAGQRSIADAYLYVVLRWAKANQVDLSAMDHLAKFVTRMEADPAVKKVLDHEGLT